MSIVVKIELWPCGQESQKSELGRLKIDNIGNLTRLSDYFVTAHEMNTLVPDKVRPAGIQFKIYQHRRIQSVFALVAKAAAIAVKGFK